jgi:organic radical activating enzyme
MKIHYKRIDHERTEDAPFMGALISAVDCHFNCKGCFNQYLKTEPTLTKDSKELIEEVKSNSFNQGIILGGLEWTEQPIEMIELILLAIQNDLQIILYTGYDESIFMDTFPDIYRMPIYIKFGQYDENLKTVINESHHIKLATENQRVKKGINY